MNGAFEYVYGKFKSVQDLSAQIKKIILTNVIVISQKAGFF